MMLCHSTVRSILVVVQVLFNQSVIEEAISPSLAISLTWAKIHINLSLSSNIPCIQLLLSLQQKDSMMQTT